jgi:catechol 2,3-dioxygenase-like lactoylglutathione lyase family enzyme
MSTKLRFGFVIEYVKDIEVAKRFYIDVLGLEVQRQHPTFIQFETFALATDEPMGGEAEQELYWLVDNAEAALSAVSQKTEITLPLKELPFGKVFGIRDPDGRPRYLLELAKNRPSQPTE